MDGTYTPDPADTGDSTAPAPQPKMALGMRQNNPLNLRYVEGQPGASSTPDNGFGVYPSVQAGIASNLRQLLMYQDHGINTIRGMVTRWVSDPQADLRSYIGDISSATGVDPDQPIDLRDPKMATAYFRAAQPHESGPTTLSPDDISGGVKVGLSNYPAPTTQVAYTPTPHAPAVPAPSAAPAPVSANQPPVPSPAAATPALQNYMKLAQLNRLTQTLAPQQQQQAPVAATSTTPWVASILNSGRQQANPLQTVTSLAQLQALQNGGSGYNPLLMS